MFESLDRLCRMYEETTVSDIATVQTRYPSAVAQMSPLEQAQHKRIMQDKIIARERAKESLKSLSKKIDAPKTPKTPHKSDDEEIRDKAGATDKEIETKDKAGALDRK